MISRRALVRALTVALAAPLAAGAQQPAGVFRIGILANYRLRKPDLWDIFIQGLRELGYLEGRNITIEWRVSEGRYERLPEQAAELARLKVDVIVVPANQNARGRRAEPVRGHVPGRTEEDALRQLCVGQDAYAGRHRLSTNQALATAGATDQTLATGTRAGDTGNRSTPMRHGG